MLYLVIEDKRCILEDLKENKIKGLNDFYRNNLVKIEEYFQKEWNTFENEE